jgi:hypothetical protein
MRKSLEVKDRNIETAEPELNAKLHVDFNLSPSAAADDDAVFSGFHSDTHMSRWHSFATRWFGVALTQSSQSSLAGRK